MHIAAAPFFPLVLPTVTVASGPDERMIDFDFVIDPIDVGVNISARPSLTLCSASSGVRQATELASPLPSVASCPEGSPAMKK
jgi:hypothetical protein